MRRYVVYVSDRASADMEELHDYVARQLSAPGEAADLYDELAARMLDLEIFPERFRLMDAGRGWPEGLRRMIVGKYHVLFVVEGERVIITNVLHSASDFGRRILPRRSAG